MKYFQVMFLFGIIQEFDLCSLVSFRIRALLCSKMECVQAS